MGAPTDDRLGIVRALLETAPDSAVRDLNAALWRERGPGLGAVRDLVRAELADRQMRDLVMGPVLPLCAPRLDAFPQALYPAGALGRLWKGLRVLEPRAVIALSSALTLGPGEESASPAADQLCRSAAAALRTGRVEMQAAIRFLEEFRPGSVAQFAAYLELAPLAREAAKRLPLWLRNMTGEHAAALRLLFKDADSVSPDASPRLLEMLQAQIDEPWKLLRVIGAITGRASDRYLSSSELSAVCERVMADVDRRLEILRGFDPDQGPQAASAAAAATGTALAEIAEFEACLDLHKGGPWGQRIGKQKAVLCDLAEGHLRKTPRAVAEAVPPLRPLAPGGGVRRPEGYLEQPPNERLAHRAMAALTFLERSRTSASQGGYGALRARICEEVVHRLNAGIEDILAAIHAGEAGPRARTHLDAAADFMALAQDEAAAQIVRRRAAAAA